MDRFKITKIGLLNFWLYDEEEYDFYGGKLILRGTNGSGKSVTMQSFIPLILDGNKSPDRLDPFGSKERKIEDYIIGDSESIQKEESTAYLYMETYNEEMKQYITIGLGFRGRKGRGVDSWGFCLKDGKRVNKDFYLYKDPVNKIPLTKNELKSRLGTINEFTDSTKDYKEMVNRLLFGFANLDTYDEFIKLLLQLRSNKLSKDYKPTNLIDVLNKVLQPLTEEELRPLSEAISEMNKTKEQIEILEKNNKTLKDFMKIFQNYNAVHLYTKAKNYKNVVDNYNKFIKNLKDIEKNINDIKSSLDDNNKRLEEVLKSIEINSEMKQQYDNSDLKQKIESLAKIKENIEILKNKITDLSKIINANEAEKIKISKNIANLEDDIYKLKNELEELQIDLKTLANDSYFQEFKNYNLDIDNNDDDSVIKGIFMALHKYKDKVSQILELLNNEEKILNDSEETRIDFEKLNNTYQKLEEDLKANENNLKESIMSWEEDFINKVNNNEVLKLNDTYRKQIFELMNDYTKENFDIVKNLYNDYARDLINNFLSDNLSLENKLNVKNQEKSNLEHEYKTIELQDDVEIPSLNSETEEILKNNNIKSVPLYKCIEYKSSVNDKTKNNLESALLDLNILNAKIIDEKDISKLEKLGVQVLYLTKSTKKSDNLLKYFDIRIDKNIGISESYVKEILESISINANDIVSISENGKARMDILNSLASKDYKQSFIGYLKRLEIKKLKLRDLEDKIEVVNTEINNITNIINNNNSKIDVIKLEMKNLPDNKLINDILDNMFEIKSSLKWVDVKQKELEEKLIVYNNKLNEIKAELLDKKKDMLIPLNKESYKETLTVLGSINEMLQNFKNLKNIYVSKKEIKFSYQERLEDIINNIEYQLASKNEKIVELEINEENEKNITELLETKEFQEQKEKLLNIENDLRNLNKEKDELLKIIATLDRDIEYKNRDYEELQKNKEALSKELEIYKEIFLREYKLHYVYNIESNDTISLVKMVINEDNNRKDKNLMDVEKDFYKAFNFYSLELNDYSLRIVDLFNDYEEDDEHLRELYINNKRIDVIALYQGRKVNVIDLAQSLENDILENKDLISKQDRHLFEDILLNTVGEKIRNKINSSNEWVKKINNIMKTMQENSALRFKLVWKSNTVSNEGEIDTKELVRILQMDPLMLKDNDREELTNHFRTKIKKAEELYADSFVSFAKIIEEVLDYRSWFTFQLFYERKGEEFKELTDKTFAKFSGGERAKSMYIPLFASVYAKLNLARSNALRIIALDEAFAGVDEDNIREMFGILNYLDIDFIINSQVLWGDYDTINDLSICELIRPQNSSVVTVERYRWNGKYKELINNRKEYNEELENA